MTDADSSAEGPPQGDASRSSGLESTLAAEPSALETMAGEDAASSLEETLAAEDGVSSHEKMAAEPGPRPADADLGSSMDTLAGEGHSTLAGGRAREAASSRHRSERELARGDMLGRYVVISLLGRGGMGVVYAAYDPELDRKVALKVVRPSYGRGPSARRRLQREAQAIAQLSHPNVVHVHDVGVVEGRLFIAMEFVDGLDLRRWLEAEPRSHAQIVDVFRQAGEGLAAAHAQGLVHRDFKPDNVLVGRDGRARVLDFGLVRTDDASVDTGASAEPATDAAPVDPLTTRSRAAAMELTADGALLGTPGYMSPEQFAGRPGDARSDQFSFCVALFEAFYGQRPFPGETLAALTRAVLEGDLQIPPSARVPPRVRRVIVRGLEVDPSDRYRDLPALLAALDEAMAPRRGRWWALAAVGLLAAGGVATWAQREPAGACEAEVQRRVQDLWSPQRQAAIERRFLAIDKPFAAETWQRVKAGVDDYVQGWSALQQHTCEVARDAPEPQDDGGVQGCLDERLRELGILLELLEQADLPRVLRATQMTHALTALDVCVDEDEEIRRPVPADPDLRERVGQVRTELQRVRLLSQAGDEDEARALVEEIAERSTTVGYPPLQAEVTQWRSSVAADAGDAKEAVRLANLTFEQALACRHDFIAFDVAVDLVHIHGVDMREQEPAEAWARRAEALRHRLGNSTALAQREVTTRAAMLARTDRYKEANALYEEALRLATEGDDRRLLSVVLNNAGNVLAHLDRRDEAIGLFRESLEITRELYGENHPVVLRTQANVGITLVLDGDDPEAVEALEEVLPLQEAALGESHPEVANTLEALSIALAHEGQLDRAEPMRRRVLEIRTEAYGADSVPVLAARINLANHVYMQERIEEAAAQTDAILADLAAWSEPVPGQEVTALTLRTKLSLRLEQWELALAHARRVLELCATMDLCELEADAWATVVLGVALVELERPAEAVAPLRELLTNGHPSKGMEVRARFTLARALGAEPAHLDEARALVAEALRLVDAHDLELPQTLAEMKAWQREHP